MVDAEDLKSFGHCDRVGSSPTIPTTLCQRLRVASQRFKPYSFGCVAQLVRALRSHRRGQQFESAHIHHVCFLPSNFGWFLFCFFDIIYHWIKGVFYDAYMSKLQYANG